MHENTDKKTTSEGVENEGKTFSRLKQKLQLVFYFLFNSMVFTGVNYFNSKNVMTSCIDWISGNLKPSVFNGMLF